MIHRQNHFFIKEEEICCKFREAYLLIVLITENTHSQSLESSRRVSIRNRMKFDSIWVSQTAETLHTWQYQSLVQWKFRTRAISKVHAEQFHVRKDIREPKTNDGTSVRSSLEPAIYFASRTWTLIHNICRGSGSIINGNVLASLHCLCVHQVRGWRKRMEQQQWTVRGR